MLNKRFIVPLVLDWNDGSFFLCLYFGSINSDLKCFWGFDTNISHASIFELSQRGSPFWGEGLTDKGLRKRMGEGGVVYNHEIVVV